MRRTAWKEKLSERREMQEKNRAQTLWSNTDNAWGWGLLQTFLTVALAVFLLFIMLLW